jgi:hypothetical protein
MRHTTTAIAIDPQAPLSATYPTRPTLQTQPWRPTALVHLLRTWMASVTRRRTDERREIHPDFPRRDTPTDLLARHHTYLYARSLSGV